MNIENTSYKFKIGDVLETSLYTKQPPVGFLNPKLFKVTQVYDKYPMEDIKLNANLLVLSVVNLSLFLLNKDKELAFDNCIKGFAILDSFEVNDELRKEFINDLSRLKGLDDESIISAINLARFDIFSKTGYNLKYAKNIYRIVPKKETLINIRRLIKRNLYLLNKVGDIKECRTLFNKVTYTNIVKSGRLSFLANDDTLIQIKISKRVLNMKDTLFILIVYLLLNNEVKKDIKHLVIINPLTYKIYKLDINDIDIDIINEVSKGIGL